MMFINNYFAAGKGANLWRCRLPRGREEHGADRDAVCALEPVDGTPYALGPTGSTGVSAPKTWEIAAKSSKPRSLGAINWQESAVLPKNCTI